MTLTLSILAMPLSPVAAQNVDRNRVFLPSALSQTGDGHMPTLPNSPLADTGPVPLTPPDEPVYVATSFQIGRTTDFKDASPHWANITPPSLTPDMTISDFILDPFHPYQRALIAANGTNGGIWYTDNLDAPSPTWTEVPFSSLSTGYTDCTLSKIGQISANPSRDGAFVISFATSDNFCEGAVGQTLDGGHTWNVIVTHDSHCNGDQLWCGTDGGPIATGAGGQVYEFDDKGGIPTWLFAANCIFPVNSGDGGSTWQMGQGLYCDQNDNLSMYASQTTPNVAIAATQNNEIAKTVDGGQNYTFVSPTIQGEPAYSVAYDGVNPLHILSGFIGVDGQEHIFMGVHLINNGAQTQSHYALLESTDEGDTWRDRGPLAVGGCNDAYAVHPLVTNYWITVGCAGSSSIEVTYDANTWLNRTGDWTTSSEFNHTFAGNNFFVTAPSFVQIRPKISPDQTAGFGSGIPAPDNWYLMPQADPTGSIQPVVAGVNPFTQNYAYSVTDLAINTQNGPLGFRRIYSVRHLSWKDNGLMGPGWTNSFQVRLIFPPTDGGPDPSDPYGEGEKGKVVFQDANGNRQEFTMGQTSNGTPLYTSAQGYLGTLTRSGTAPAYTYTLILYNQTRYVFNSFGQITQADRVLRDGTAAYIDWHPLNFVYDTPDTFSHLRCVVDGIPGGSYAGQHYLALNYNSSGQIAEVSDNRRDNWNYCTNQGTYTPTGSPAMTYNYVHGYLDSAVDLTQGKWQYTYGQSIVTSVGAFNLLTTLTDPQSDVVESMLYDAQGRVLYKLDPHGNPLMTFNYVGAVNMALDVKVADTLHPTAPTTYHYSMVDNLNTGLDFYAPDSGTGQITVYHSGLQTDNFRPSLETDPYQRQITTQYTGDAYWPTTISDQSGNTWTYTINPTTNTLVSASSPLPVGAAAFVTPVIRYDYDLNYSTLPTKIFDPLNRYTQFDYYDPLTLPTQRGNLKDSITPGNNPDHSGGMVTHYDYDSLGQISQITVNQGTNTPNNNLITRFRYDSIGRQIASVDPLQRCNVIQYDDAGRVTKTIQNYYVADSQGVKTDCLSVTTLNYDVAFDPAFPDRNVIAVTHYDLAGKVDYTLDTLGNRTTYVYDDQRRVHIITKDTIMAGQSQTTTYDYDALGNLNKITDANNEVTILCYDNLNRQVRTIQNYTAQTDPCSLATLPNGAILGTKPDENVITSQVYDANGNVTDTYNALGQDTHADYDRTRNLQSDVITGYDPSTGASPDHNIKTQFAYDAAGNLQSTLDPNGQTTTFCYNLAGQPVRQVVNASDLRFANSTCAVDYLGNVANTDQDLITNFVYNAAGQRTDTLSLMDIQVDPQNQNNVQSLLWDHQHTEYLLTGNPLSSSDEDYQSAAGYESVTLPDTVYLGGQVLSTNTKTSYLYDNGGRTEQTADLSGRNTHVYYDDADRPTKVIQNYQGTSLAPSKNDLNITTSVTYDGLGRPLTQTDANGRITTHLYDDTLGKVTILDPLQHPSSVQYDVMGNVSQMTDANGNTTQFGYDHLYRQISVTTPPNTTTGQKLTTQTLYDSLGNVTDRIDANNIDNHYTYDFQNRLTQVDENCNFNGACNTTGTDHAHTSYVYDQRGLLQSMTPSGSGQITYVYDKAGRRTTVNGALLHTTWTTTYDKAGRVRTQSAPNGAITTTTYQWTPDHLHQTQISDFQSPLNGLTTTLTYDALGRVSTMVDSLGQTTYNYDSVDRLLSVQDPNHQTVSYDYYPDGNLLSLTMPGNKPLSYLYDGDGRLQTVTDWVSNPETYSYDPAGRLTDTSLPTNGSPSQVLKTHYGYDPDNQLRSIRNQSNSTLLSEFDYTQLDNVGNRKQVTELIAPTGIGSATSTPVVGQPDQVTFASPRSGKWQLYTQSGSAAPQPLPVQPEGAMSPSWSPDGTKLAFAGLKGGQWDIFTMDASGWNVTDVTPNNAQADDTSPAWSPDGKKIAFTSRVGGTADIYTINPDGSALSRLTGQNGDNTSPSWSPDSTKIAFTSNRTGQWNIWTMAAADGSNATQLTTDATAPNTSPAWSPDNTKIAYSAVQNNNADLYTIPPAGGQPTLITDAANNPPDPLDLQPAWSPDSSRLVFRSNRKTAPATDANYDLWAVNVTGTPNLQQITTGGFNNDQPTWTLAPSAPTGMTNRSIAYQYDGLNRLTSANYQDNGAQTRSYSYQYDYASNRTVAGLTTYGTSGSTTSTDYYYNAANELTCSAPGSGHTASDCTSITDPAKHSFTYDLSGNLLNEAVGSTPLNTYTYNAAQQLTSADNLSYTYNGLGDRYSKTVGGVATNYVLDLNSSLPQVLTQTTPSGTTTYRGDAGEQKPDGSWSYYSKDGLGSIRQLSNATGQVTYAADYDPYGVPLTTLDTTKTTAGFTGQQTDENGLIDLRARDYNPTTGTFLTRDPFGGNMNASASMNGYGYVGGNPVNHTDMSGKCIDPITFMVCAVVGGAIIGAITGAAYDVFANQGVGLGGKNQGNLGTVNWKETAGIGAVGAGIGTVTAASSLFIGTQVSGLVSVGAQQGLTSLAFTQAAQAAMWNIGGSAVLTDLSYRGLSQLAYNAENPGLASGDPVSNVDQLIRSESSNPILADMFVTDFGLSAYGQFQSLGGWTALRAQFQNDSENIPTDIDPRKISEYMFGRATNRPGDLDYHNIYRSNSNALQMERLGIPDNAQGYEMIQNHLEQVAQDTTNIVDSNNNYETRQSLLAGPSGKFASLQSTWAVSPDGTRRLVTVIPQGGGYSSWTLNNEEIVPQRGSFMQPLARPGSAQRPDWIDWWLNSYPQYSGKP